MMLDLLLENYALVFILLQKRVYIYNYHHIGLMLFLKALLLKLDT